MMALRLVVVVVVVFVGYLLLRPRPLFRIRIRGGEMMVDGRVSPGFVTDCERIFRDTGVENGAVSGEGVSEGIRLHFSGAIRREHRQRYRNAWQLYA